MPRTRILLSAVVGATCLMSMLSHAQDDRSPDEAVRAKSLKSRSTDLDEQAEKPIKRQDNDVEEGPQQKKPQTQIREKAAPESDRPHDKGHHDEGHHDEGHHDEGHHDERPRGERPHGEHAMQRLHHLHVAIENLKAAGMHDLARETAERAEAMEREMRELHEQRARKDQFRHTEELEDLRREVRQLRDELQEFRRTLKPDSPKLKSPKLDPENRKI